MNNAGNVAENRQNDIEPEMLADSDLEKHSKGRQDDRKNDFQQFHLIFLFVLFGSCLNSAYITQDKKQYMPNGDCSR